MLPLRGLGWQLRGLFNPDLRKWLHRIKVPTHVIWGDADKIIDPAYAEEFRRIISGAQVTMLKQTGHLPHIEDPQSFVEAVSEFIEACVALAGWHYPRLIDCFDHGAVNQEHHQKIFATRGDF